MSGNAADRLPPAWVRAKLEEFCDIIQGQSPPGETYNTLRDGLPFFQGKAEFGALEPMPVKWCSAPTKLAQPGDVLVSVRAPVGPTNLCPMTACIGRGLAAVRPLAGVPSRFLLYAIRSTQGQLAVKGTGSTFDAIGGRDLRIHELPVAPLPEQQRIVAEIEKHFSRLEAAVAALRRARANLKRYRASVLKAACEGQLVPTEAELACAEGREYEPAHRLLERILKERRGRWEAEQVAKMRAQGKEPRDDRWKEKYHEPAAPDTNRLPRLTKGWVWASIGQLFEVYVGATPSRARPEYWGGEIPWVSSGEVAFCRIRSTREAITELGLQNSSTEVHPPGTVLIGMIGEGKTRGQVAILDVAACNNQNSAAIRVSEAGLPAEYVYRYLEGQYERTRRLGSGNNQPALNKARVQAMVVVLPPLAEQQRIVAEVERRLSVVDETEALVDTNLRRAERLRQAILKRAFEGRLVPQDPKDEPASVLLERIRAERAQALVERGIPRRRVAHSQKQPKVGSRRVAPYDVQMRLVEVT